ncbi:MAG: hypothetical protein JWO17_545 [Actinomycetia bacterium]|nr:hypothetical protein [Actinomycetes bacterium]
MTRTPERVRDLLLVGLTFSSGAVDAISYFALGKVFTAFMTGNLVFVGLSIAGAGTSDVVHAALSLAMFVAGVALSQSLLKPGSGHALWPPGVSVALALVVVAQACFLAVWLVTSGRPSHGSGALLVILSALAMGIQSNAVRSLGVQAVFTTAATATLIALAADLEAGNRSAPERLRLTGILVGLLAGACAGALVVVHARSYAAFLPLVVTTLVLGGAAAAFGTRGRELRPVVPRRLPPAGHGDRQ